MSLKPDSATLTLPSSDSFRLWGDIGHVATLVSTVVFAACAVAFVDNDTTKKTFLFDTLWMQEGFCVTNRENPIISSHAVCLYVDVALAVVLAVMYWRHRHWEELKHANSLVTTNVFGIIGHGIAHGAIAYHKQGLLLQSSTTSAAEPNVTTPTLLSGFVFPVLFWLPLMKAALPNAHNAVVGVMACLANWTVLRLPENLGFTGVQTILMLTFSLNQLLRPAEEKMDLHFSLYAWIVSFPVTLVGWMESTQCSVFVKNSLYGHVAYDAYIVVSVIAFYTMCIVNANQQQRIRKSA
jgi:hypothetical protein